MALNLDELIERARQYVEIEADTTVKHIVFAERFTLFGQEDVVLYVVTEDDREPEWWVVGGSTPINLYAKSRIQTADEAFSFHTGIMIRLQDRNFKRMEVPPEGVGYDAFISHASEDKDTVARPLAEALKELGFWVWYDEFTLEVGDSLRQSIDKGLINSRYGIVILSKDFFKKQWPQYELNGLSAREIEGTKVILPVWYGVEKTDVLKYSPPLADKVAVSTKDVAMKDVAKKVARVLVKR